MPRYGDDQCEECGGVRVARSKLCADCLVKALDRMARKKQVLQSIIDMRNLEVGQLNGRLNEALAYGFKQNQENVKLNQYIKMLERGLKRRMTNEESRV